LVILWYKSSFKDFPLWAFNSQTTFSWNIFVLKNDKKPSKRGHIILSIWLEYIHVHCMQQVTCLSFRSGKNELKIMQFNCHLKLKHVTCCMQCTCIYSTWPFAIKSIGLEFPLSVYSYCSNLWLSPCYSIPVIGCSRTNPSPMGVHCFDWICVAQQYQI